MKSCEDFAKKLREISRTTLPYAVKNSLNSVAFDVKKDSMPKQANLEFIRREKNFFKANSRVEMAKGNNVNLMQAKVGFISRKGKNQAIEDLEQQEHGGIIGGRSFIPLDFGRTGNVNRGNVRKKNRISSLVIVKQHRMKANSKGGRFAVAVKQAGVGGYILGENGIVWRVDSLKRNKNGQNKLTGVFNFKKNRSVKVNPTHFMEEASIKSYAKMEGFFIKKATELLRKQNIK